MTSMETRQHAIEKQQTCSIHAAQIFPAQICAWACHYTSLISIKNKDIDIGRHVWCYGQTNLRARLWQVPNNELHLLWQAAWGNWSSLCNGNCASLWSANARAALPRSQRGHADTKQCTEVDKTVHQQYADEFRNSDWTWKKLSERQTPPREKSTQRTQRTKTKRKEKRRKTW